MPTWDFPRNPAGARLLVRAGTDAGLTVRQCLAGTDLQEDDLHSPARIEATQELRVGTNLVRHLGNVPGLGIRAGRGYTLGTLGVWSFALLTSPTWGDALEVGARYFQLTTAFIRPQLLRDDDGVTLILHDDELPDKVRELFTERDLAAVAVLATLLVDELPPVHLETKLDRARAAMLSDLLPQARCVGDRPRHRVLVQRSALDLPLPQADEHTWESCTRECQALLDQRHAHPSVAARVRSELLAHPERNASMDEIAARMHQDVRTLRRKLTAEGTSFRALKAETHATLAMEMLGTVGLSVSQVAQRLGYTDPTSFSHAFTRWTGAPPASYRIRRNSQY